MVLGPLRSAGGLGALLLTAAMSLQCVAGRRAQRIADRRAVAADSIVILPGQLGPVRACDRLADVTAAFAKRPVRDTVYQEAAAHWPVKRIVLEDGVLEFAASWSDTTRVWNMSTTSPSVRTKRGFHVGMRLGEIMRADSLDVELVEGAVVVHLRHEGVGALVDASAEQRFYERYRFEGLPTAAMLSPEATITTLLTGGTCR
jgi:hypothetical protein